MKHLFKISALIILLAGMASVSFATSVSVEEILLYTNEYRKVHGKPVLILDEDISALADKHSNDMASGKTRLGHEGFTDRINALKKGNTFISAAAENVASGYGSAQEVIDGWIKSTAHRENLLGDYTHIGIGVARAKDGRLYYTQIFIRK